MSIVVLLNLMKTFVLIPLPVLYLEYKYIHLIRKSELYLLLKNLAVACATGSSVVCTVGEFLHLCRGQDLFVQGGLRRNNEAPGLQ